MSDQTPEERPRDLAGSFFDMEGNRDKAPSADSATLGEERGDGRMEAGRLASVVWTQAPKKPAPWQRAPPPSPSS